MELSFKFKIQCILWIMRLRKAKNCFAPMNLWPFIRFLFFTFFCIWNNHLNYRQHFVTSQHFVFNLCNFRNQDACYNFKWNAVIFLLRNTAQFHCFNLPIEFLPWFFYAIQCYDNPSTVNFESNTHCESDKHTYRHTNE